MEEEYKLMNNMKKTVKNRKSINDFILSLNNSAFMFIFIAYLGILLLALFIITPKKSFIVVPNYEHNTYAEEIVPQITLVALRSKESDGSISLRYNVSAKLHGRLDENNADPRYPIDRFQMSASLTNNQMYFFTEQKDRTTAISHTYTMSTTDLNENIPETFFIKLNYRDLDGEKKIDTFKENIMVDLPAATYTTNNKIKHMAGGNEVTDLEVSFIAKKEADNNRYLVSVWINVSDMTKKYHVDMQTWIVTEDGQELPFMGVYGYSDQRNSFYLSNREVILDLQPKEIYCRLVYYNVEENKIEYVNYKQELSKLPESYGSQPNVDPEPTPTPKSIDWLPWTIGAVVIVGGALGVTFYFTKKRKKEKETA